jgi:hypothetical protein
MGIVDQLVIGKNKAQGWLAEKAHLAHLFAAPLVYTGVLGIEKKVLSDFSGTATGTTYTPENVPTSVWAAEALLNLSVTVPIAEITICPPTVAGVAVGYLGLSKLRKSAFVQNGLDYTQNKLGLTGRTSQAKNKRRSWAGNATSLLIAGSLLSYCNTDHIDHSDLLGTTAPQRLEQIVEEVEAPVEEDTPTMLEGGAELRKQIDAYCNITLTEDQECSYIVTNKDDEIVVVSDGEEELVNKGVYNRLLSGDTENLGNKTNKQSKLIRGNCIPTGKKALGNETLSAQVSDIEAYRNQGQDWAFDLGKIEVTERIYETGTTEFNDVQQTYNLLVGVTGDNAPSTAETVIPRISQMIYDQQLGR